MTGKCLALLSAILGLHIFVSLPVTADREDARRNLFRYATLNHLHFGCGESEVCMNQTIDPELLTADFDTFSLTESQVKAACKGIRDQMTCMVQYTDCIPSNMRPLVAPIQAAIIKQGAICDDANLYADFQAIKSCVMSMQKKLLEGSMSRSFSPVLAFSTCPYVAMVAGKSAYDELMRVGAFGGPMSAATGSQDPADPVKPAEIAHGVCCAGKAIVGCGVTMGIEETCSSDAVAAIRRQMENTLAALNCPAINAARPCKMTIDF